MRRAGDSRRATADSAAWIACDTPSASRRKAAYARSIPCQLHNGFVAELLSPITASSQFTFPMAAGVYTKGAAGQVDPYRLVHAVILLAKQKGAQIYENTAVTAIRPETAEGEYAAMELDCATAIR